jgi:hypothetical protein
MKRGLKKLKEEGEEAVSKELEDLKQTFAPQNAKDITADQLESAL